MLKLTGHPPSPLPAPPLQEYYANTGALVRAAQDARQEGRAGTVGCSIVEAFGGPGMTSKPRELEEVLRLEYRSKLLNPK